MEKYIPKRRKYKKGDGGDGCFLFFVFHAFVPFCKRDRDVKLGSDGPYVLRNLLTNWTICVARADEGKGGGTTVL